MTYRNTTPMHNKQRREYLARKEQRIGDTEELLDWGLPVPEIVTRVGYPSPGAAERYLVRHGRHDLARPFGREDKRTRKSHT